MPEVIICSSSFSFKTKCYKTTNWFKYFKMPTQFSQNFRGKAIKNWKSDKIFTMFFLSQCNHCFYKVDRWNFLAFLRWIIPKFKMEKFRIPTKSYTSFELLIYRVDAESGAFCKFLGAFSFLPHSGRWGVFKEIRKTSRLLYPLSVIHLDVIEEITRGKKRKSIKAKLILIP